MERPQSGETRPQFGSSETILEALAGFGRAAAKAAANLDSPEPEAADNSSHDYAPGDRGTFEQALDLISVAEIHERSRFLPEITRIELGKLFYAYRISLPFDEAERAWLVETSDEEADLHQERIDRIQLGQSDEDEEDIKDALTMLLEREGHIVSAGLTKPVSAQQLLSRWSQWRRDEGPFRGENGVRRTQQCLLAITSFVLSPTIHEEQIKQEQEVWDTPPG